MIGIAFIKAQNSWAAARDELETRQERGAAMAEYGLLLALIALAAITILGFFGGEIFEVFDEAEKTINNRGNVPPPD